MDKTKKKVSLSQFEEVAANNGYEVYTSEEIADYAKEGLMKSKAGRFSQEEKDIFTTDMMYLQKAVVSDENGNDVTRYYRKQQVAWEAAEDGTIMKGLEGVYLDTPENRRLNRVGEAFVPSGDFMKSLLADEESYDSLIKALRTGRYADTPENRRLHRVGQPYSKRKSSGSEKTDEEKTEVGDTKSDIKRIDAKYGKLYTALGKKKQEATASGDKQEIKRIDAAISKMEKLHDAEIAKLKEKEGGEKGDERLHAKADERKGGEKGDEKLHREADKNKKEPTHRKTASEKWLETVTTWDIKDPETRENFDHYADQGFSPVGKNLLAKVKIGEKGDSEREVQFYDGKKTWREKVKKGSETYKALKDHNRWDPSKDSYEKWEDFQSYLLKRHVDDLETSHLEKELAKVESDKNVPKFLQKDREILKKFIKTELKLRKSESSNVGYSEKTVGEFNGKPLKEFSGTVDGKKVKIKEVPTDEKDPHIGTHWDIYADGKRITGHFISARAAKRRIEDGRVSVKD